MAYTDFIAAIDLGTSHMVGMVGTKNATGALSIIAYEVENSGTCIRRGCVYNVKETASKIKRLIPSRTCVISFPRSPHPM